MHDQQTEGARLLCRVGRLVYQKGYVAANDGNLSLRLPGGGVLITPSCVGKGRMRPEQMVRLAPDGAVHALPGFVPSSEAQMHTALYAASPDIGAVVHVHAPHAVCFGARGPGARWPALCADIIVQAGYVPVAPYVALGTRQLADTVASYAASSCAVLLQNHGLVAWGRDLWQAFDRAEAVEHYFRILASYEQTGCQGALLTPADVAALEETRRALGESRGAGPWVTAPEVRP